MKYEAVIGMEVHVELSTAAKIFCGCSTKFGSEPNTQVCPVCLGMPGVLPVLNKRVVESALMVGLALNCKIAPSSKLDRKNYFYPDLPKNYQISQYDLPLCYGGYIEVETDGSSRRVRITRVHMEEDTGKNIHPEQGEISYVDFNRTGVPLLEIVTEPDLKSPLEAYNYLEDLKDILQYLRVSDCNMEEGSLRAEANVSVRPVGSEKLGTKTEIKNVNSFKGVLRALEYEVNRQIDLIESGQRVVQETLAWDEARGCTTLMRSKESAPDYRYFPEPDLVPLVITQDWIDRIKTGLPELPLARKQRFIEQYGLPEYDARVLTASRDLADFFEEAVGGYHDPKAVSNWIMGDFLFLLKESGGEVSTCPLKPENLVEMLKLIDDGRISGKMAKDILADMFKTGKSASAIVKEKGLAQITDTDEIRSAVRAVIADHPGPASDFRQGKDKTLGFLVGQVMKRTHGKANPQLVNAIIKEELGRN